MSRKEYVFGRRRRPSRGAGRDTRRPLPAGLDSRTETGFSVMTASAPTPRGPVSKSFEITATWRCQAAGRAALSSML